MVTDTLSEKKSSHLAQDLGHILANTYILYLKTQNFHWNVTDPRFHSLHEFFEEHYKQLAEAVDDLAERIRTLGVYAPASMKRFLELGSLEEAESHLSGDQMLRELLSDHETLVKEIRVLINKATDSGDEGSADLLIERLRYHEKTAWMIRSHFHTK